MIIFLKTLTCNLRNVSEKAHFLSKSTFVVVCLCCVYANYLYMAGSCSTAFKNLQFSHALSTTMFVQVKNLNFIVEYVQEKFYFSNVGRKIVLFYHALKVYILKHTTHANSSTLLLIVLLLSLSQLIHSTNFHPNTKKCHD